MNSIAKDYLRIALEIGQFDPDFVDSYFGPGNLKPINNKQKEFNEIIFEQLNQRIAQLLFELENLTEYPSDILEVQRYTHLFKQLLACKTRLYILNGMYLSFDEELRAIYDIEVEYKDIEYFDNCLILLDKLLPGRGEIIDRFNTFKEMFRVPEDKIKKIFDVAMYECRQRTSHFIKIPPNEKIEIRFVKNKPWSAYNWFNGNAYSLIEINTDLPIYINRIIDLAAHEGYPGHHLHHTMMEYNNYKKRKWVEFSIYLLFSPYSVIAEGIAGIAPEILFPRDERIEFEKKILFPLAGIGSSKIELFYDVMSIINNLNFSINIAAKNYINSIWDDNTTVNWIQKYNLRTEDSAKKQLDFIKKYRAYIAIYAESYRIIKYYLEKEKSELDKWNLILKIISLPICASDLENILYEN